MAHQYKRFTARFVEKPTSDTRRPDGSPFDGAQLRMYTARRWRPPVDLCETSAGLTVTIELAGLRDDDTNVTLFDDAIVVEGERTIEACDDPAHFHRSEIFNGPFRVEVPIPFAIDPTGVDATYHRGVLQISLPRGHEVRDELPALPVEHDPDRTPTIH
jgi:HSP20 family molecular chaperone IbpA